MSLQIAIVAQRRHGPLLSVTSATTGKCKAKPVSCSCNLHTHSLSTLLGLDIAARLSKAELPFYSAIVKLNSLAGPLNQELSKGAAEHGMHPIVLGCTISVFPTSLVAVKHTRYC